MNASNFSDLAGWREDRNLWTVIENENEFPGSNYKNYPCYLLSTCRVCKAQILVALGVRGRRREHCSAACRNYLPMKNQFFDLIEDLISKIEDNSELSRELKDAQLLRVRSDLQDLILNSAMQSALSRKQKK